MASITYRESGYQVFPRVFLREEVAAARPEVARHVASADRGQSRSLIVPFELTKVSSTIRDLLLDPRPARIAAELLGVEQVRYLHASAYYKVKGAPEAHWHQDLWFMPLPGDALVTLWIPLCDVDETMAPLVYAVGSHRGGLMKLPESFDPNPSSGLEFSEPVVLQAGDLTAHHGWTLHASTEPESERPPRGGGDLLRTRRHRHSESFRARVRSFSLEDYRALPRSLRWQSRPAPRR